MPHKHQQLDSLLVRQLLLLLLLLLVPPLRLLQRALVQLLKLVQDLPLQDRALRQVQVPQVQMLRLKLVQAQVQVLKDQMPLPKLAVVPAPLQVSTVHQLSQDLGPLHKQAMLALSRQLQHLDPTLLH